MLHKPLSILVFLAIAALPISLAFGDDEKKKPQVKPPVRALVNGGLEDLTSSGDLLDTWGLIPAHRHYRNFYMVPTLLGQGLGYMLARMPGPAASRMQSARRAFPKDDLFFREYLFAKCWEQGVHRRYGELSLSPDWKPLRDRINTEFVGG